MTSSRRTRGWAIGIGAAALAAVAPAAMAQTGGSTPQPPAPPAFAPVPERPPVTRPPDPVRATLTGLLIEQRISSAAIRRTRSVEEWINAGLITADLAGGSLTGRELMPGIGTRVGQPHAVSVPSPRPLDIPEPERTGPVEPASTLRAQLAINQRISVVAVARINALTERMNGGLTGGDIRAQQVGLGQLQNTLYVTGKPANIVSPAASTTNVVVPPDTGRSSIRLSDAQALINQRIAQAAVRRSNALLDLVRAGIPGESFQEDTIGSDRLGPSLP